MSSNAVPGRDAPVGVALGRVVDEAAGLADPLLRGRRSALIAPNGTRSQAPVGCDAEADRPGPGEELNTGCARRRRARRRRVIVLRGGATALEVLLVQRNAGGALHGRRLGVPRRRGRRPRGRRRRGPPRGRGARAARRRPAIAARRPGGARQVLALDHAAPRSRSASTRTSSSRRCPTGRSRRSTGRRSSTSAGSRPRARSRRTRRGELPLVFPTIKHLEQLSGFPTADALLAHAAGREVVPVEPRDRASRARSRACCCPATPGYDEIA